MEILDASVGRMVSGGNEIADDSDNYLLWDGAGSSSGSSGGKSYEPWEAGWGSWNQAGPPSEGHLEFDNKLADAVGLTVGNATTAFVGGFLEGAALGSEMGPGAILSGIVVGGFAAYGAKKALAHNK